MLFLLGMFNRSEILFAVVMLGMAGISQFLLAIPANVSIMDFIHFLAKKFMPNSKPNKVQEPSVVETKKSPLKAIVEALLGIGLAIAVAFEVFPMIVSLILGSVGLILIWVATREAVKGQTNVKKVAAFIGVVFYIFLISVPLTKKYKSEMTIAMTFKDSPDLSWYRKQVIAYDLRRFRNYLTDLGIPFPVEIPPFGTVGGPGVAYAIASPPNLPPYRSVIAIGKSNSQLRRAPTLAYSSYVIERFAYRAFSEPNSIVISHGLAHYFGYSFWGKVPENQAFYVCDRFWSLRQEFGAEFTDKLAAATLKTIADNSAEVRDKDVDVYLTKALMVGDSIVENECERWPKIKKVLVSQGMSQDKIESQKLILFPVSTACIQVWRQ